MRPSQYTLTPNQVHQHATALLQTHLKLHDHGPKCRAGLLLTLLFYAAARITSLSDACKRLREAPSDEAARLALLATLPDFAETQRQLNRALAGDLPKALRKRRQRMAIDLTLIPYHGAPAGDPKEIVRSKPKSGTSHFHAYATAYVIHKHHRSTVALTAVRSGEPMEAVLQRLLHQAARVGVRPCLLLLDRGFFSVGVIRYLQAARHPFLMPVICRGRKLDDPRGPSGTNIFLIWKQSGWSEYTLREAQGRTATVSIGVKCRYYRGQWQRHGRQRLVYAFWALSPPSIDWVRQVYRLRFAIETTYRQMHQARIRTSTRDPLLRLLYVGVALVLRNAWVWFHYQVLARPRRGGRQICLELLRFRTMLLWLVHVAEATLGTRDTTPAYLRL
jgi:Transposase DDE domain